MRCRAGMAAVPMPMSMFPAAQIAGKVINKVAHPHSKSLAMRESDAVEVAVGKELEQTKTPTNELIRLGMLQYSLTGIQDFWVGAGATATAPAMLAAWHAFKHFLLVWGRRS